MNWQVAIKTSNRKWQMLTETVKSIRASGWADDLILISTEKNWEPPVIENTEVVWNRHQRGPWPHFVSMAKKLMAHQYEADYYLLCEDDVTLSSGLRPYLDKSLPEFENAPAGVFSLYCDRKMASVTKGLYWCWVPSDQSTYGSVALVMRRDVLTLVTEATYDMENVREADTKLGEWLQSYHLQWLVHRPSLAQHVGMASTGGHIGLEPARVAFAYWAHAEWI